MNEEESPEPVRKVDYADPRLPTGAVFKQLEYPADHVGYYNPACLIEAADTITLQPGSLKWRVVGVCVLMGVLAVAGSYRQIHHRFEFPCAWAIIAPIFVLYAFGRLRKQDRTPWIVVDRGRRAVYLPRARKTIPFAEIVRVQVVSFARTGWSANYLGYHGDPGTGEVQLVFNDKGRQEVWCVIAWPPPKTLRRFLHGFHTASGIPIARVRRLSSSEWEVERFDVSRD